MTANVPAWFQTAYTKGVINKFQSDGYILRGMTTAPVRFQGKELIFRVAGRGEASEMSSAWEQATPMNASRDTLSLTTKPYQAADTIRHPDINKMSIDEQAIVQQQAARALGRKFDRVHFATLDGLTLPAAQIIAKPTAEIDLLDVANSGAYLRGLGTNVSSEVYCPLPPYLFGKLALYKEFSMSDWTGDQTLALGQTKKKWSGVTYFEAPNELFTFDTGAAPDAWKTAASVTTYMWAKDGLGAGSTFDLQSRISWENLYTGYFANNWMDLGVRDLLPEGIVRMTFKFAGAAARPT